VKCKIEILPSAWEDLKKIEDYYLIKFDLQTAINVSDHILDTIERLENFPDSGSQIPNPQTEYTKLFINSFIIL